jgi:hypothetical protein
MALFVVGAVESVLGFYPPGFGVPDWEFGSISNFLDRLPLLGLGVTLLLVSALARGSAAWSMVCASLLLLLALVVLVLAALYATNLPLVIVGLPRDQTRIVILKAMVKAGIQSGVYALGFLAVAIYAVRSASRLDGGRRRAGPS